MNIERTAGNCAIAVITEYITRRQVNNCEAHVRQFVLKGNAKAEYSQYNRSLITSDEQQPYRKAIWEHLKTGLKFDKEKLKAGDFWAGRVYNPASGKSTTYAESMIIAPPFKIHPDELASFLKSEEYKYFEDMLKFLKDDVLKDAIILGAELHNNEIYVPETITLEDGTEYLLPENERWAHAYCKPHCHIVYIPTVKATDKNGVEYLKLSRGDMWRSKSGRFSTSYTEFNDRKYEAVDKHYGMVRGTVYDELPEESQPVRKALKKWQEDTAHEKTQKLIQQQQEANQKAIQKLNDEAEQILKDSKLINDFDNIKKENEFLKDTLNIIRELIQPLKLKYPKIFNQISKIINQVLGVHEQNNNIEF